MKSPRSSCMPDPVVTYYANTSQWMELIGVENVENGVGVPSAVGWGVCVIGIACNGIGQ